MAKYIATAKAFRDGELVRVGDTRESATDPGFPFVPAHQYKPYEDVVERVQVDAGFVIRDERGDLVPIGKASRLVSRSPHELRPFARD